MLISGPEKRCRDVGFSAVSATLMPIGSTVKARPPPDQLNQNAHGWDQPSVFFRTPHSVPVYTQVESHELMECFERIGFRKRDYEGHQRVREKMGFSGDDGLPQK